MRRFLHERNLLSVPEWLQRYRNSPTPDYIEPIADWGCLDDLTSASRLDEDGRRVCPPPFHSSYVDITAVSLPYQ